MPLRSKVEEKKNVYDGYIRPDYKNKPSVVAAAASNFNEIALTAQSSLPLNENVYCNI